MPKIASLLLTLTCLMLSTFCFAQKLTDDHAQMATGLRSSGKIYVVVAVLLTILAGVVLYLIRLDRKITRLEKH